jgi:hypothetical protein
VTLAGIWIALRPVSRKAFRPINASFGTLQNMTSAKSTHEEKQLALISSTLFGIVMEVSPL